MGRDPTARIIYVKDVRSTETKDLGLAVKHGRSDNTGMEPGCSRRAASRNKGN